MLAIVERVEIPEAELRFSVARSGGPGGQNVNKVSTRVTLMFDVDASPSLNEEQRQAIRSRLGNRIGRDGVLQVVSQATRSQVQNKELAIARFVELLRAALAQKRRRVPTGATRSSKELRIRQKKARSGIKTGRSRALAERLGALDD